MTDYSIPAAMIHRVIPSMFNAGDFPVEWIGDNPTLDERRQYIHDYVKWRLPHDDMEKQERELRDLAERKAAMKLINEDTVYIGAEKFEWLIDEMFWHIWLGHLGNTPRFPWPCPTQTNEPEKISQSFVRWLGIYRREGDLVKAPEPSDSAPSHGSEQHRLSVGETTATAQGLADADKSNESEQLQKLSEQVYQLQQELRQRDERIARRDKKIQQWSKQISQKNRRIRQLENLLQLEKVESQQERDRQQQLNEILQSDNRELRRLQQGLLEAWRQQLNEQVNRLSTRW